MWRHAMSNRTLFDPPTAAPLVDRGDARRENLLKHLWPTSAEMGRRAGDLTENPAQWTKA